MLNSAEADLASARVKEISCGWRLSMAYAAALRYARAALYASGYRPGREREHEHTIDSLGYTLKDLNLTIIAALHKIRKKRHTAVYDSIDTVSETEADDAIRIAVQLGVTVMAWLKTNHRQLFE